jgi:hypothetical protein
MVLRFASSGEISKRDPAALRSPDPLPLRQPSCRRQFQGRADPDQRPEKFLNPFEQKSTKPQTQDGGDIPRVEITVISASATKAIDTSPVA